MRRVPPGPRMLTFQQATRVVGRHISTLHRWRVAGMATSLDEQGRRIVREDELWRWRQVEQDANPAERWRRRRRREERERHAEIST